MKTNVSYESIVNHLVDVFQNPELKAEYMADDLCYESFAEWCPLAMSPLTRGAYFKEFGAVTMVNAEAAAQMKIRELDDNFKKSSYSELLRIAESNGTQCPEIGGYYFALDTGWKCDEGTLYHSLCNFVDAEKNHKTLVNVGDIIEIDDETMNDRDKMAETLEDYIKEKGEDLPYGYSFMDESVKMPAGVETSVAHVFAVVCGSRWFFVDSEGFSYARYIFLPLNGAEMYAPEIAAIKDKRAKAKQEEEEREAKEKEARRAEYVERCRR